MGISALAHENLAKQVYHRHLPSPGISEDTETVSRLVPAQIGGTQHAVSKSGNLLFELLLVPHVITGGYDINEVRVQMVDAFRVYPPASGDVLTVGDAKGAVELPSKLRNKFADGFPPPPSHDVAYEKYVHDIMKIVKAERNMSGIW